jgi:hypothetical protein
VNAFFISRIVALVPLGAASAAAASGRSIAASSWAITTTGLCDLDDDEDEGDGGSPKGLVGVA